MYAARARCKRVETKVRKWRGEAEVKVSSTVRRSYCHRLADGLTEEHRPSMPYRVWRVSLQMSPACIARTCTRAGCAVISSWVDA
ncbi:hypothetical protein FA95DRAFT_79387 [Auriscalpium vulgare]|uniref:Uncharacterized protein n=1 Tax=Auriscalpium vulgare TaxID=40419 RepID=A0ACB8RPD4_9AGAM|nr:hypothetical protein FA95DRAFT_79387 [Auriscalpium vulgare]